MRETTESKQRMPPPPSEDISRDDVRAQREAKKLAKATRKNKSLTKAVNPLSTEKETPVISSAPEKARLKTGAIAKTEEKSKPPEMKPPEPNSSPQSVSTGVSADLLHSNSSSVIHSLFKPKKMKEMAQVKTSKLYPPFYNVGLKVRNNVIRGANSQCVKLLDAIKDYVRSYDVHVQSGRTLKHGLLADLEWNLNTLKTVCTFPISMSNAVQFLLFYLHNMPDDNGNAIDFKNEILEMIDQYVEEKIEKAVEAIVLYGLEKINEGDKIIVYSITEALMSLLVKAAEDGVSYELILVQTKETKVELVDLLDKLKKATSDQTVRVSAVNFSSALYKIRSCSKLLIGGHGLFTNGGVMAQSGSGQLALVADTYNKPVVFLCETFKFSDKSPLDFLPLDEYMPEQFQTEDDLLEPNLMYDVTPSRLVTVVITDIDMLPSNGLAATLRVQEGRTSTRPC